VNDEELKRWNDARLELFAGAKLPPHALAAILHDTRRMEYDRAIRALAAYRAERPYRGFYAVDWARHYNATRPLSAASDRTDGGGTAAASRREDEQRELSDRDKAIEIRDYNALTPAVRDQARTELASLGWPMRDHSRAWRIIVLNWARGVDVSAWLHPSRLCKALPDAKSVTVSREELRRELLALIQGAHMRIEELEAGGTA
jgi:hypothetical protein